LETGTGDGVWFACAWLAMFAGPEFGDYQASFRFGRLGYEQVQQRGLKRFQASTYFVFGGVVLPWMRHYRDCREPVLRAFEAANETGDVTFALYSSSTLVSNFFGAGDPLAEVQREAELNFAFAKKTGAGFMVDLAVAHLGLIRMLRGLTRT